MADDRPETSSVADALTVAEAFDVILRSQRGDRPLAAFMEKIIRASKNLRPHMIDDVIEHLYRMENWQQVDLDAVLDEGDGADVGPTTDPWDIVDEEKPDPRRDPTEPATEAEALATRVHGRQP